MKLRISLPLELDLSALTSFEWDTAARGIWPLYKNELTRNE